ncbi:MAG: hypothetical protein LUM44_11095 [Pyrinomonadaceae bacterium]|nr:hypothetical protein [Pyrinomonadaceae bacterium]
MQENQNPDVNSVQNGDETINHSEADQERINNDIEQTDEDIPLPPDSRPSSPVEEPPESEKPSIDEDDTDRTKRIL